MFSEVLSASQSCGEVVAVIKPLALLCDASFLAKVRIVARESDSAPTQPFFCLFSVPLAAIDVPACVIDEAVKL